MSGFLEFLAAAGRIWVQHPIEFAGAVLVGILIGFFLVRLRYQGRIDAQKEHLDFLKAAGVVTSAPRPTEAPKVEPAPVAPAAPPVEPPKPAPVVVEPKTNPQDPRFVGINSRVLKDTEAKIYGAVRAHRFKFVFNPETGKAKPLTFLEGGWIGDGKNDNEHRWRVVDGRLEILNSKLQVYSRFYLLPDGRSFQHTNDPDTISIKGQYMAPM